MRYSEFKEARKDNWLIPFDVERSGRKYIAKSGEYMVHIVPHGRNEWKAVADWDPVIKGRPQNLKDAQKAAKYMLVKKIANKNWNGPVPSALGFNEEVELDEAYRVHAVSKTGEKFSSGIYDNKKKADDMHYKMAKSGNFKSIEVKKEETELSETIRKQGSKWVIYSKSGDKKLGTYDTKSAAQKRLRQIEYFKHNESVNESKEYKVGDSVTVRNIKSKRNKTYTIAKVRDDGKLETTSGKIIYPSDIDPVNEEIMHRMTGIKYRSWREAFEQGVMDLMPDHPDEILNYAKVWAQKNHKDYHPTVFSWAQDMINTWRENEPDNPVFQEAELKVTSVAGNKVQAGDGVEIDLDQVDLDVEPTTKKISIKPKGTKPGSPDPKTMIKPGTTVSIGEK